MLQSAIFVDAGYLFAAGSALIAGEKQPRTSIVLETEAAIAALTAAARAAEPNARLLRLYWYDGTSPSRGPSPEQIRLAHMSNVKLRLGFVNSQGQQKGVDSLIVTDLIELARNHAISDAIVMSGDEDIRVGVQIAQTYGIRVHLLGIRPARGSQSLHLLQEVDTHLEWGEGEIHAIMSVHAPQKGQAEPVQLALAKGADAGAELPEFDPKAAAEKELERLQSEELLQIADYLTTYSRLPREVDSPLLGRTRAALGRDLVEQEKRDLRRNMRELILSAATALKNDQTKV